MLEDKVKERMNTLDDGVVIITQTTTQKNK